VEDQKEISINNEQPNADSEKVYLDYEFGDLYLKCSCGQEDLLAEGIEGGIRIDLLATNSHTLKMKCSKCKHEMQLIFKEAKDIFKLKEQRAEKKRIEIESLMGSVPEGEVIDEDKRTEGGGDSIVEETPVEDLGD
jgi:hypothetical protein